MKSGLDRALWWLYRLEDALLVGLLLGMIVLAVAQIVLRDGFQGGLLWLDPLLRILVLWIALWGAVVGSREQRHVSIDLLGRFVPEGLKRYMHALNALFVAVVCGALAWYSFDFVHSEYIHDGAELPTMAFANVPAWICESVMPVSFALIAFRYAVFTGRALLGLELPVSSGVVH